MLLGRLRIWGKLTLLSVIPLLAIVALTVPTVLNRANSAGRAGQTARAVRVAAEVGSLVQDLQQERLLSVGLLLNMVGQSELTLQITANTDRITDIRQDFGPDISKAVSGAIGQVRTLVGLRKSVLSRTATPDQVMTGYGQVITGILESLRLLWNLDTSTAEGRQVVALDSLLKADEATAAAATALAILAHNHSEESLATINSSRWLMRSALNQVAAMATSTQLALRQLVNQAFTDRFGAQAETSPQSAIAGRSVETIFPAIASFITLGNFVEKRIVADVTAAVDQRRATAMTAAYLVGGLVTLVIVLVLLLGFTIARTVTGPLTRLTTSAERVAQVAESELIRVADDEADAMAPIRLDSLNLDGRDEIGELARAFDRVQSTASLLVERQVNSRRNIAEMFGHIGRRANNLVSRQVVLIDDLERDETDPNRLLRLYRLDHLSNRMLRNASSLVVLSGSQRVDEHVMPVLLSDIVRLALGEIEDYERVDTRIHGDAALAPGVVTDLTLVIAELMENAALFSPPTTRVTVTADRAQYGALLTIVDQGIGMSEARMAQENSRLAQRERLDLAPTQVLGLFVVGRLARRHRIGVALTPTLGGGVTATINLGEHLLVVERTQRGHSPLAAAPQPRGDTGSAPAALPTLPAGVGQLVRRAGALIAAAPSWDAFSVARRSRSAPQTQRATPIQRATPPQRTNPTQPVIRRSPSGLRQRIPGTHHPAGPPVVTYLETPPTEADAAAARDLLDQFGSGVARAINDFHAGE